MRRFICCAVVLLMASCPVFAQKVAPAPATHCAAPPVLECAGKTADYAGIVREVSGNDCFVQSGKERPIRIRKLKKLYAGDALQCGCTSSITVGLITGPDQTTRMQLAPADRCFQVPLLSAQSGRAGHPAEPGSRSDADTIVDYGNPGGPARSQTAPVYSPSFDGAARPAELTIRWVPSRGEDNISFSLWNEDGGEIWPAATAQAEGRADMKLAQLSSAFLRTALLQYRDHGGEGTLELRVTDSAGHTYRIPFSLLSKHSEEILDQELAQCDANEKDALLHLCRAAAYRKFKLFPEMAAEYDLALKIAPDSEDLLQNAIAVNERTGNTKRVQELKAQLQAIRTSQ